MIFLIATFLVSLAAVLGGYWLFVVRVENRSKASIARRLKPQSPAAPAVGVVISAERLSQIPFLEGLLARRMSLTTGIRDLLVQAGLKMRVGTFVLFCFVGGSIGWAVGWAGLRMMAAAVVLAAAGASVPFFYVRYQRTRRLQLFEEQFPEAIDLISRALRAGHALTAGLALAAEEIPAPVGAEFRRVYDEQNFGLSLPDALRGMAARVPVLDARFFVTAVLTQRESGGNLSEILDNLASVMRDRFKLRRQIRVISAHGRISAWVLALLPLALGGVLFLLSPKFMSVLIEDPWGVNLMMLAAALQVIGTIIISRMVRIEY